MKKQRLDKLVADAGLAASREKAQRLIRAGRVRVAGQPATKPGHLYATDVALELEAPERFVSRGGHKLEAGLTQFRLDVRGLVCVDVGASTGGFTDCLLQNGAAQVYAVDVGKGQLDVRLRNDPRVVVMEKENARYLRPEQFAPPPVLAVIDVAFISLTKILPAVTHVLPVTGRILALVKPQFEAGRKEVGKGGVVRDPAVRQRVVADVRACAEGMLGLDWLGVCESPLRGPAGNVEYLAYCRKR